MRFVRTTAALLAIGSFGYAGSAQAVQTPAELQGVPSFETADGQAVRPQRSVRWFKAPRAAQRAWSRFVDEAGQGWSATWDTATGAPSRIWGRGVAAPGALASEAAAESFARAFLARHVALLAPGAAPSDFVLAANDLDDGIRTVGFFQHVKGLPVVGGQVSFRFKNDRLIAIGSEALPHARADVMKAPLNAAQAKQTALAWILTTAATAKAGAVDGPMVLPLVRGAGAIEYRTVARVVVTSEAPIGKWAVYVDVRSGAPVAREQLLHFAQGTVLYNAPIRYPSGGRKDYPAGNASLTVNGTPMTTDATGLVTWNDSEPAQVLATLSGPLVKVLNDVGPEATSELVVDPDGQTSWGSPDTATIDAQLASFVHAHEVKAYCKGIAPTMGWLNSSINVTVNIDDVCNAFSDGTDINFYKAGSGCENTGRLADVVYHEFGHSFHAHAIIPGVGAFDGALSEGQADYLSATMNDDSGMGRGFFMSGQPLREINPKNKEHTWPDDIDQDTHETGLIIGGTLWDLRTALMAKYGEVDGVKKTDKLYYQSIRRAVDIPSMYVEAIAANDDDGDLENGTPDICEINAAFSAHGLREHSASVTTFAAVPPTQESYHVAIKLQGVFPDCADEKVDGVELDWKVRGPASDVSTIVMKPVEGGGFGEFEAEIPKQAQGKVVQYRVVVKAGSGTTAYPDNAADPWYEFFVGETKPLYCTDFEKDPFAEGWTHGLTSGQPSEGADDWQWADPKGTPGSGDPDDAYSGKRVLGNDLGGGNFNGNYQGNKTNFALSPVVQTEGHTNVRLQYRRWLNVEDGYFDQASIYANGTRVWQNLDSMQGEESSTNHRDKEWRFHDVDLSSEVKDGAVQVKFEIASDPGFEVGGWTIDDVCFVAYDVPGCGDGVLQDGEECDNGSENSDTAADSCRTDCSIARCGDGVKDGGEQCDDGNDEDGDGCTSACTTAANPTGGGEVDGSTDGGCGCRTAGGESPSERAWWLVGLPLAVAARRRRRG